MREAERFNWAATRGVNEELLFENMPDDLQRDIRRHLFIFLKKVKHQSLFPSVLVLFCLKLVWIENVGGFAGEDIFFDG